MWFKPYLTKRGFLESCKYFSATALSLSLQVDSYLGLSLLLLSSGLSGSLETRLLLLLGLRAVLVKELEQLSSSVLVESVRELSDSRGNLETLAEDDLLALKADVFGPFDETSQVGLGLNVLAYICDVRDIEEHAYRYSAHQYQSSWGGTRRGGSSES